MDVESDRVSWLEALDPGYFTLTMATGIVSIGLDLLEMPNVSDLLHWATLFSWLILFFIYLLRLALFPRAVWGDLINPRVTFNFFSFVAATSISGLLLQHHGHEYLALLCWAGAFVVWSALLYCSFGALILRHAKRDVNVIHGGWLICIVGTQSLVLLGLNIIGQLGDYASYMMVGIFMLWGLGLILYGILITLISYRVFFLEMNEDDYSPRMWVIMGAAAISANASSTLDMAAPVITVLYEVHAVIDSVALLTWAWATWWIPLLVVIGFWRHVILMIPLRYEPGHWSIVFPLGMYTVASIQLSLAAEFDPLHWISHVTIWAAIGVWGILMFALFRRVAKRLFMRQSALT